MKIIPTPRWRVVPTPAPGWWSLHTHSRYSVNDAMAFAENEIEGFMRT